MVGYSRGTTSIVGQDVLRGRPTASSMRLRAFDLTIDLESHRSRRIGIGICPSICFLQPATIDDFTMSKRRHSWWVCVGHRTWARSRPERIGSVDRLHRGIAFTCQGFMGTAYWLCRDQRMHHLQIPSWLLVPRLFMECVYLKLGVVWPCANILTANPHQVDAFSTEWFFFALIEVRLVLDKYDIVASEDMPICLFVVIASHATGN